MRGPPGRRRRPCRSSRGRRGPRSGWSRSVPTGSSRPATNRERVRGSVHAGRRASSSNGEVPVVAELDHGRPDGRVDDAGGAGGDVAGRCSSTSKRSGLTGVGQPPRRSRRRNSESGRNRLHARSRRPGRRRAARVPRRPASGSSTTTDAVVPMACIERTAGAVRPVGGRTHDCPEVVVALGVVVVVVGGRRRGGRRSRRAGGGSGCIRCPRGRRGGRCAVERRPTSSRSSSMLRWVVAPATATPIPTAATVAVTPMAMVARRMRTRASSLDRTASFRSGGWAG